MVALNLTGELADLAKAVGLVDASDELDPGWFADPFGRLQTILSETTQREAVLRLLDSALPPVSRAGEKWHALLPPTGAGNLYLTVRVVGGRVVLGLAGEFGTNAVPSAPSPMSAHIGASIALVELGGPTVVPLAGNADGPLIARLRVGVNLQRPAGGNGIALSAIAVEARATTGDSSLAVVLEGLSIAPGQAPADKVLDPADLGGEAPELIAALLSHVVAADPVAAGIIGDVLGLLGLADSDVPAFPFAELAGDPTAVRRWLASLFAAGAAPPAQAWLTHFAGLFESVLPGPPAIVATSTGLAVDLIRFNATSSLSLALSLTGGIFRPELSVRAAAAIDGKLATIEAGIALIDIDTAGVAPPRVLPQAHALIEMSGSGGADLVPLAAGFRVGSARAGIGWDGEHLQPLLELTDVRFGPTDYARLDLTNTDSVSAAASNAILLAIQNVLGAGTIAMRLLSLIGLEPPRDPLNTALPLAGWPHAVDLTRLVTDPLGAIAAYHRAVLTSPAFSWDILFGEVLALIGLAGTPAGAGTLADPWRVPLGSPHGALQVALAAWDRNPGAGPADPARLRIGLRLEASSMPFDFSWLAEILAFDLAAAGTGSVTIVGAQHLRLSVEPAFSGALLDGLAGTDLSAEVDKAALSLDWTPGGAAAWRAGLEGIRLHAGAEDIVVPAIAFPPPAGFDLSNPAAAAAAFGLTPATLESLIRLLATQAAGAAGPAMARLTGLLGMHAQTPGLPADWPTWSDPAAPGQLLTDPLAALRSWLMRLVTSASADGLPHVERWIAGLRSQLLQTDDLALAGLLSGTGSYDEPWTLPAPLAGSGDAGVAQLHLWVDPEGPPLALLAGIGPLAAAVDGFDELLDLVRRIGAFDSRLRARLSGRANANLATGLTLLADILARSDGIVDIRSQQPPVTGWSHAAPIVAEHWSLPTDAAAIAEIGAKVDELAGGVAAPRLVLLLAPRYTRANGDVWAPLLASSSTHGIKDAGASFDLADPSLPDPATYPLETVTAVADWYTAWLPDDDVPDWAAQAAHITRIAGRLAQLRPGVPLTIVAHSTLGLAARHHVALNQAGIAGLITLATPHLGASLPFLADADIADAVRLTGLLTPQMGAHAGRAAIESLMLAVDGYAPAPAGTPAPRRPFPFAAFDASGAELAAGPVPVHTIGATADPTPLIDRLKVAAASLAGGLGAQARAAPARAGLAVSIPLGLPASVPGVIAAEARVRFDLLEVAFDGAGGAAAQPVHGTRFSARLFRRDGWLLGNPSTLPLDETFTDPRAAFDDVRLREIELGLDAKLEAGAASGRPWMRLRDAAVHGPTIALIETVDAFAAAAAGALFRSLTGATAPLSASASAFISALDAIGLLSHDADGISGLAQDAWSALEADPIGFVAAHLPGALASPGGWMGLTRANAADPWAWSPGGGVELSISHSGTPASWSARLRTGADGAAAGPAGPRLAFDAHIALPSLAAEVEVTASFGPLAAVWHSAAGSQSLSVALPPWIEPVALMPSPGDAALTTILSALWPRLIFSGAVSVGLHGVAPGLGIGNLERLLTDTAEEIRKAVTGAGGAFTASKVRTFIDAAAIAAGLPPDGGLALPGGLRLTVDEEGPASAPAALRVRLATTTDIGGVLGVDVGVRIDAAMHATPFADLALAVPVTGGTWGNIAIRFGIGAQGATLSLVPGGGASPITLLPTFSGFGDLRGAAQALLPAVLDQLVTSFGPAAGRPDWLRIFLELAEALDLYDQVGGFAAKTTELRALLDANAPAVFASPAQVVARVVALIQEISALPIAATVDPARPLARLAFTLPAALPGTLEILIGFDGATPTLGLSIAGVAIANTIAVSLEAAVLGGGVSCTGELAVKLDAIHVPLAPLLRFTTAGGSLALTLYPTATLADDGPLTIDIAPDFGVNLGVGSAEALVTQWLLPLVANTLLGFAQGVMANRLWPAGPTIRAVLQTSGVVTGTPPRLVTPLPDIWSMLAGAVQEIANGVEIDIGELKLSFVAVPAAAAATRLGMALRGRQGFQVGNLAIDVLLGAPDGWEQEENGDDGTEGVADGLKLLLVSVVAGVPTIRVGLGMGGIGLGLHGAGGGALLDEPSVRIGGVDGYFFADLETVPALRLERVGGGVEIRDFGIPLGALTSGAGGGGNPVVTALLGNGGSSAGDNRAPTPGVDLACWYREDDGLHIRMRGGDSGAGVLWIGVHSKFGPIYIDQVGVRLTSEEAGLVVDGGVSVAGLSAQVDDLSLTVPFSNPANATLDLKGLGLGFSQPGITISGALVKYSPPIEYAGMLLVKVGPIGAIAVGSYAVPEDGPDRYTSLAVFGGVFVPIVIPPVITINALGLGLGLNRRLLVPDDLNEIPNFFLIEALDRPEEIANDPMRALLRFRAAVPPKRGSFWLAAGLRGTCFEIVHVTGVLYIALDTGLEIGVLGLARAALPADDMALVSLELALKARFSTAEMLLSIQAQLTDNSWILSRDCQLTGGFAFFMWFRESQFLLSIGGYHPAFQRRPEYPNVPRLGYRWNLFGVIQIKGESYFALTNSCVMAGVRIELVYGPGWLQLWFTAHADFLAQWDPFYFMADVGISVGARLRIEVCFIRCVRINISVSVGAELHLEGPPIHGTVTVDLGVTSVTVPFGDSRSADRRAISWAEFRDKYLLNADPEALPVGVQVENGLLKPDPPGAKLAPGTEAQPWQLATEWRFRTETRMPVREFVFVSDAAVHSWAGSPGPPFARVEAFAQTYDIDIAPMKAEEVESRHRVFIDRRVGNSWQRLTPFDLDADRFVVEPQLGQVAEATYHLFPDLPPAAANTLPAILGLTISGRCELKSNTPDPIPIAKLVDSTNPRPLPFADPDSTIFANKRFAGRIAELYPLIAVDAGRMTALLGARQLLSGAGTPFAENRRDSGVFEAGLGPVATHALVNRRSSPPLVAPLSTGLSMDPVARDLVPPAEPAPRIQPVPLVEPRLRAVVQAATALTAAAAPAIATSVSAARRDRAIATFEPRRDLVQRVEIEGAALHLARRSDAPAATRLAVTARSLGHPDTGASVSRRHRRAFLEAEGRAAQGGATVRAGVTQLWEVPIGGFAINLDGDQAVRLTFLSRGGGVLEDREYAATRALKLVLPARCAGIAVTGLGRLGEAAVRWAAEPASGAVTGLAAPAGGTIATGWQSSDRALRLSSTTLLTRGSIVRLTGGPAAGSGRAAAQEAVAMAAATAGAGTIETALPASTKVVAIVVESHGGCLPGDDDLELTVRDARLEAEPVRVGAGGRTIFLFDVLPPVEGRAPGRPIAVGISLRDSMQVTAMVGLGGTARGWGEGLNGKMPEDWVPDGPLTPDGQTRVRIHAERCEGVKEDVHG